MPCENLRPVQCDLTYSLCFNDPTAKQPVLKEC